MLLNVLLFLLKLAPLNFDLLPSLVLWHPPNLRNKSGFELVILNQACPVFQCGGPHAEGQPYVYIPHNEIRDVWCPHPRPPLIP